MHIIPIFEKSISKNSKFSRADVVTCRSDYSLEWREALRLSWFDLEFFFSQDKNQLEQIISNKIAATKAHAAILYVCHSNRRKQSVQARLAHTIYIYYRITIGRYWEFFSSRFDNSVQLYLFVFNSGNLNLQHRQTTTESFQIQWIYCFPSWSRGRFLNFFLLLAL